MVGEVVAVGRRVRSVELDAVSKVPDRLIGIKARIPGVGRATLKGADRRVTAVDRKRGIGCGTDRPDHHVSYDRTRRAVIGFQLPTQFRRVRRVGKADVIAIRVGDVTAVRDRCERGPGPGYRYGEVVRVRDDLFMPDRRCCGVTVSAATPGRGLNGSDRNRMRSLRQPEADRRDLRRASVEAEPEARGTGLYG